jgi:K+-transporting ATPase ATPase A chain
MHLSSEPLNLVPGAVSVITKPMGIYLLRVLDPEQEGGMGILEKIFGPIERLVYKVARIDPKKQQNWKQYTLAMLMLGMVTMLLSYGCTAFRTSCR